MAFPATPLQTPQTSTSSSWSTLDRPLQHHNNSGDAAGGAASGGSAASSGVHGTVGGTRLPSLKSLGDGLMRPSSASNTCLPPLVLPNRQRSTSPHSRSFSQPANNQGFRDTSSDSYGAHPPPHSSALPSLYETPRRAPITLPPLGTGASSSSSTLSPPLSHYSHGRSSISGPSSAAYRDRDTYRERDNNYTHYPPPQSPVGLGNHHSSFGVGPQTPSHHNNQQYQSYRHYSYGGSGGKEESYYPQSYTPPHYSNGHYHTPSSKYGPPPHHQPHHHNGYHHYPQTPQTPTPSHGPHGVPTPQQTPHFGGGYSMPNTPQTGSEPGSLGSPMGGRQQPPQTPVQQQGSFESPSRAAIGLGIFTSGGSVGAGPSPMPSQYNQQQQLPPGAGLPPSPAHAAAAAAAAVAAHQHHLAVAQTAPPPPVHHHHHHQPSAHFKTPIMDLTASREIKRRTKTGCLTCRKRRIKCDERSPTCYNCDKSKRICLSYDPIFRLNQDRRHSSGGSNSTSRLGSLSEESLQEGDSGMILSPVSSRSSNESIKAEDEYSGSSKGASMSPVSNSTRHTTPPPRPINKMDISSLLDAAAVLETGQSMRKQGSNSSSGSRKRSIDGIEDNDDAGEKRSRTSLKSATSRRGSRAQSWFEDSPCHTWELVEGQFAYYIAENLDKVFGTRRFSSINVLNLARSSGLPLDGSGMMTIPGNNSSSRGNAAYCSISGNGSMSFSAAYGGLQHNASAGAGSAAAVAAAVAAATSSSNCTVRIGQALSVLEAIRQLVGVVCPALNVDDLGIDEASVGKLEELRISSDYRALRAVCQLLFDPKRGLGGAAAAAAAAATAVSVGSISSMNRDSLVRRFEFLSVNDADEELGERVKVLHKFAYTKFDELEEQPEEKNKGDDKKAEGSSNTMKVDAGEVAHILTQIKDACVNNVGNVLDEQSVWKVLKYIGSAESLPGSGCVIGDGEIAALVDYATAAMHRQSIGMSEEDDAMDFGESETGYSSGRRMSALESAIRRGTRPRYVDTGAGSTEMSLLLAAHYLVERQSAMAGGPIGGNSGEIKARLVDASRLWPNNVVMKRLVTLVTNN